MNVLGFAAMENAEPSKFVNGTNVPLGVLQTFIVILHDTKAEGKNNPAGAVPPHSRIDETVAPAATVN